MEEDSFGQAAIDAIQNSGIPPLKSAITDWNVDKGLLIYKK